MTLRKSHLIIVLIAIALNWQACKKQDNERPVITLNGDALIYLPLQGKYIEYGANAHDNKDGDIAPLISGFVNTSGKATYTITYSATDKNGNVAKVVRTVIVQNPAEYLSGTFHAEKLGYDSLGVITSDSLYIQTISSSTTVNNKIVFTKFASITFVPNTTVINADIDVTHLLLNIPPQNSFAKINNVTKKHYYWGNGTLDGDSVIQLTYFDSLANMKSDRYTIRMTR